MSGSAIQPYTLEAARSLGWSSIGGELAPYRVAELDRFIIGRSILDAGCGGGGYVDYLARKGYDATGVDAHAGILLASSQQGFAGRFVLSNLNVGLPFPTGSFDTVYCFDVLEHLDDVVALQELARVAKRRVIFTVPQQDTDLRRYGLRLPPYLDPTHLRYYTPDTVRALVATINPSPRSVHIEPECSTNIRALAIHRLHARSRFRVLSPLYGWLLDFILARSEAREFHWNLLAVVDF